MSLGCKLNQAEGDAMGHRCAEAGYELVPFEAEAEVYVVNTCTVAAPADREGSLTGLTDNYLRVALEGPEGWRGRLVPVRLEPLPRGWEARGRAARAECLWGVPL